MRKKCRHQQANINYLESVIKGSQQALNCFVVEYGRMHMATLTLCYICINTTSHNYLPQSRKRT